MGPEILWNKSWVREEALGVAGESHDQKEQGLDSYRPRARARAVSGARRLHGEKVLGKMTMGGQLAES